MACGIAEANWRYAASSRTRIASCSSGSAPRTETAAPSSAIAASLAPRAFGFALNDVIAAPRCDSGPDASERRVASGSRPRGRGGRRTRADRKIQRDELVDRIRWQGRERGCRRALQALSEASDCLEHVAEAHGHLRGRQRGEADRGLDLLAPGLHHG